MSSQTKRPQNARFPAANPLAFVRISALLLFVTSYEVSLPFVRARLEPTETAVAATDSAGILRPDRH